MCLMICALGKHSVIPNKKKKHIRAILTIKNQRKRWLRYNFKSFILPVSAFFYIVFACYAGFSSHRNGWFSSGLIQKWWYKWYRRGHGIAWPFKCQSTSRLCMYFHTLIVSFHYIWVKVKWKKWPRREKHYLMRVNLRTMN